MAEGAVQPQVLRHYIGGRWVDGGPARYPDVNPATGEVLAEVPVSGAPEVDRAAGAAAAAFDRWRRTPAPRRGEIIFRCGEILRDRKEELARLLSREMGKPIAEARGDVQEAIDMAYYIGAEGRRLLGYQAPAELPDKFAVAVRDPIGVAGIITPWNFPIAVPSWKIFPALIAGNTVVYKPAPDTPLLAVELARALEEAGLPGGALNLIVGGGAEAGEALTLHPLVKVISFTGSTATGKRVAANAALELKRVSLELGGKNAVIVLADADLDLAVQAILWSAFGTSGQRCTACSRVLVERPVARRLLDRLVPAAAALRLGDGLDPETQVGPLINRAALERVAGYVAAARQEGATVLTGGGVAREGPLGRGFFFQPTVLGGVRPEMRVAQEEIFGPVLSVIEVEGLDEAIAVNNAVGYGLSSSIFTRDVNAAFTAMRDLATGIVYVNAGTTGSEVQLPFGGTRGTGNGRREAGLTAIDAFTEWKSIYVDYSGRLQRAQIDRWESA